MCIPAAIFEYEEELETGQSVKDKKEKKVKPSDYCFYSGLPSPSHYGSQGLH